MSAQMSKILVRKSPKRPYKEGRILSKNGLFWFEINMCFSAIVTIFSLQRRILDLLDARKINNL